MLEQVQPGTEQVDPLLRRIRSEFLEMPGMCLTVPQAARLWNLDQRTSQLALHSLVDGGFLTQTDDGRFVAAQRTTRQGPARPSPAR